MMIKIDVYYYDDGIQLHKDGKPYAYYPPKPEQLRYFVSGMAHMQACGYEIEYHASTIEQSEAYLMKHA
jgi:hypothetical protein